MKGRASKVAARKFWIERLGLFEHAPFVWVAHCVQAAHPRIQFDGDLDRESAARYLQYAQQVTRAKPALL